jgi:hypothetical protein
MDEAREIEEETGKLYYFDKYWKTETQTLKLESKN